MRSNAATAGAPEALGAVEIGPDRRRGERRAAFCYDGGMERPQSIVGLALHAARLRWQALTPRARMITVAAGTFFTLAAGAGAMHAMGECGSCCHGGCPSHAAAQESPCHHH